MMLKCLFIRISVLCTGCSVIGGFTNKTPPPYLVSVQSGSSHGSGTIVSKPKADTYLIITSSHVIDNSTKTACIQFFNGSRYTANIINNGVNGVDLALMRVKAKGINTSPIKFAGKEKQLKTQVTSYGYSASGGYSKSDGEVRIILANPLQGGYDIGYSSIVLKGMSGGPTVETNSKLIAINSLHPDPLWDANIYHQDGKLVEKTYQKKIEKLSMGISASRVEEFIRLSQINQRFYKNTISARC